MIARLRPAVGLTVLVALRLALDAARWLASPDRYWNWEEAYNAGVAWYVAHAGLGDVALDLQYKAFCGGCSVVSGLGAAAFSLAGDHAVVWKGVALLWTAATMVAGFAALDALVGRAAAWAWAGLVAIPPLGWSDTSLMLWGNHQESALPVLFALAAAARGRAGVAGLVAGLSIWFCRTTLFAVVPLAVLVWPTGRARAALGFGLGSALVFVPAAQGDWGSYRMSPAANLFPDGFVGAWDRLRLLVVPDELAVRLYCTVPGMGVPAAVWLVGLGLGAWAALQGRGRTLVGMLGLFAALYAAAGFPVPEMRSGGPVLNLRYHAPWFFLATAVVAAGFGQALAGVGARRWVGGIALAAMLGANLGGWARAAGSFGLPADVWGIPAVSHLRFAWMATWRLDDARLARATSAEPATEAWLRRMEGFRAAVPVRRGEETWEAAAVRLGGGPATEGLAQALTDPFTGWGELAGHADRLAVLPPDVAHAYGRGMAANLQFGVTGGAPPVPGTRPPQGDPRSPPAIQARVADLQALAGPAGCPACAAIGAAAMDACRTPGDPGAWGVCLGEVLPDDPELLWGAGRACLRPAESRDVCAQAAQQLDLSRDSAPFRAGLADPTAGMDRPFTLPLR